MALPILDGNQSATTLSTILSSGQHITAHTVVSLGTQAITDMRGAVSGSVVSISNFPASQVISGTVTANPTGTQTIAGTVTANVQDLTNCVEPFDEGVPQSVVAVHLKDLSGAVLGTSGTPLPIYGTVTVGNTVTIAGTVTANSLAFLYEASVGTGVPIIGYNEGDNQFTILRTSDADHGALKVEPISLPAISGTVTVGNSVTIASLPAISGTVTANLAISSSAITSGSFTSLTSATLVPANAARKMATVYNLGAGQLFINAGATATTLGGGFMVALSSGDFYECPYTTTTLSAIFATAGTASWVSH